MLSRSSVSVTRSSVSVTRSSVSSSTPYLVHPTTHKSATPSLATKSVVLPEVCPDSRWVVGTCLAHGWRQWQRVPCKRRLCSVCGPIGRHAIARRIAHGIRELAPPLSGDRLAAAFMVLTFRHDVGRDEMRTRLAGFIRWVRARRPGVQYAVTYELTKRGRYHINLVLAPWYTRIEHAELRAAWGARVSVEWVKDSRALGREFAKTSPESLGFYATKLSQQVRSGRRVSFSRSWPRIPAAPPNELVRWELAQVENVLAFDAAREAKLFVEHEPGRWVRVGQICSCFAGAFDNDVVRGVFLQHVGPAPPLSA